MMKSEPLASVEYRGYTIALMDGQFKVSGPGLNSAFYRSTDLLPIIDAHITEAAAVQATKEAAARGERPPKPVPPVFGRPAIADGREIVITSVKGSRGAVDRVWGYDAKSGVKGAWRISNITVLPEGVTVADALATHERMLAARQAFNAIEVVTPRVYRNMITDIPGKDPFAPPVEISIEGGQVHLTSPLTGNLRWGDLRSLMMAIIAQEMRALDYVEGSRGWIPAAMAEEYQNLSRAQDEAADAFHGLRADSADALSAYLAEVEAYRVALENWKDFR